MIEHGLLELRNHSGVLKNPAKHEINKFPAVHRLELLLPDLTDRLILMGGCDMRGRSHEGMLENIGPQLFLSFERYPLAKTRLTENRNPLRQLFLVRLQSAW